MKILFKKLRFWAKSHYYQIALFNVFLMLLVLLRSAGYFSPFFPLSVNFIVLISIIFSIVLLDFRAPHLFFLSFLFWSLAAIFRIANIEVWAERAALYTFEALVLGVILLVGESFLSGSFHQKK